MKLEIVPPIQFSHAGLLEARYDVADPRAPRFPYDEVVVDLRAAAFVRPPAVMWAATYLALVTKRGLRASLLVPVNMGVCVYLKALGFFANLKMNGVDVDDRGVPDRSDRNVVLPLTGFVSEADASALTNRAFANLQASERASPGLAPVVSELLSELMLNAAQHSASGVGSFASVQFFQFQDKPLFACTVGDGGIGIREHLRRNVALRSRVNYDWDALELSIRERVSGTGDPHRGIGLYGVSEDVRVPGRQLLLHSGLGSLEITEEQESLARRTRLFPGTLAHLSIPV